MKEPKYSVSVHVAAGVVVTFNTDEWQDYSKLLTKPNKVLTVGGIFSEKAQLIPVRNILVIEVINNQENKE